MRQKEFINEIKSLAIKEYKEINILPSLTISQAIIESYWGESLLASKYNNLFGMKWTPRCGYDYVELWTSEFVDGKYVRVKARFRKYDSWEESIKDHSKLLQKTRYKSVLKCQNYIEATVQIKKCGYATSPTYTQTLRKIIEIYELYKEDWKMDFNKKLAPNFKWGEFWSNSKRGIKIEPPEKYFDNILKMAKQLQVIRNLLNKPYSDKNKHKIIIVSGYRTAEWNKICGGANESYHMKGLAVDTRATRINIVKYAFYILRFTDFNGIGLYKSKNFIHSDLRKTFTIFRY